VLRLGPGPTMPEFADGPELVFSVRPE
jgi:hypothetical protein